MDFLLEETPQAESAWKRHVDEVHGFSLEYPDYWSDLSGIEVSLGDPDPPGVSVEVSEEDNCTTADNFFQEEVLPYYPSIQRGPVPNSKLDGFIVEPYHLDYITPGPEAYIMNCPYVIRLGFNSTGVDESDAIFEKILLSFKTWQPAR